MTLRAASAVSTSGRIYAEKPQGRVLDADHLPQCRCMRQCPPPETALDIT